MTTVFVDLVSLDGSRPEGTLRFSLERLVLGDPDVVPSAVEVKIRDGKARVENLLPGAMRVRVNAGCWSKDWQVSIPAEGEHDLLELLEWQAEDFQETVWAALSKRVEALENTPAVDLGPVEKRLDALEGAPVVDLAPLEETTRQLDNRVTALEGKPDPQPFDPTGLEAQFAEMQSRFEEVNTRLNGVPSPQDYLPKELTADNDALDESIAPLFEWGAWLSAHQRLNQVDIEIVGSLSEGMAEVFENTLLIKGLPPLTYGNKLEIYSKCRVEFAKDNEVHYVPLHHNVCLKANTEGVVLQDREPRFGKEPGDTFRKALEKGCDTFTVTVHYFTNL